MPLKSFFNFSSESLWIWPLGTGQTRTLPLFPLFAWTKSSLALPLAADVPRAHFVCCEQMLPGSLCAISPVWHWTKHLEPEAGTDLGCSHRLIPNIQIALLCFSWVWKQEGNKSSTVNISQIPSLVPSLILSLVPPSFQCLSTYSQRKLTQQ